MNVIQANFQFRPVLPPSVHAETVEAPPPPPPQPQFQAKISISEPLDFNIFQGKMPPAPKDAPITSSACFSAPPPPNEFSFHPPWHELHSLSFSCKIQQITTVQVCTSAALCLVSAAIFLHLFALAMLAWSSASSVSSSSGTSPSSWTEIGVEYKLSIV